jgi:hypothetical protein
MSDSGLGAAIGEGLAELLALAPGEPIKNYASLVGIGMVVNAVTTVLGAPAVMTPLAGSLASATALPIEFVLLSQIPAWLYFFFPYQSPILIIAMAIGGVPFGQAMKLLAAFAVFGLAVVLPLQFVWLGLLGYVP